MVIHHQRLAVIAAAITATATFATSANADVTGSSSSRELIGPVMQGAKILITTVKSAQTGMASWYGGRWIGRKTANGERYQHDDLTAAHRTLPFGTFVRVTNLRNKKSTVVRINNRGPYTKGRIIDLSKRAATSLGFIQSGVARVQLEVLSTEAAKAELAAL